MTRFLYLTDAASARPYAYLCGEHAGLCVRKTEGILEHRKTAALLYYGSTDDGVYITI